MIQPHEMKLNLPMKLSNEVVSTTTKVWIFLLQVEMEIWKK
jgi:hypothetical protein